MSEATSTEQQINKIKEDISESMNLGLTENAIVDNKLEFNIGEQKYRVHKPSVGERTQALKYQSAKFTELLKDKSVLMEADLIKQYKERNIDIEEFNQTAKNLEREKQDIQEKLGKALAEKASEVDLEVYKNQIASLLMNVQDVLTRKNALLQYSLESQLFNATYTYFTMLVTEIYKNDKWERLWATLEDMDKTDGTLFNRIVFHASFILRGELSG